MNVVFRLYSIKTLGRRSGVSFRLNDPVLNFIRYKTCIFYCIIIPRKSITYVVLLLIVSDVCPLNKVY